MFSNHLNRRILIGFFLALAIMAWMAVYSYINTRRLISSSKDVAQTHALLHHSQRLLAVAANMELGQRGYSLTGNEEFLEPYINATEEIFDDLSILRELTKSNERQFNRMAALEKNIGELVAFSSSVVEARKDSYEGAWKMNDSMRGKEVLDRIRNSIIELESEEKKLLDERIVANEEQIRKFNISVTGLLSVSCFILLILLFTLNENMKVRTASEKTLIKAAEEIRDLYDNAPCGYHSLDRNGVFVEINKTMMEWLGYENKEEIIGKLRFEDVISATDLQAFRDNFPSYKKRGFVHNVELSFKKRDGTEFPVILSSTAIFDEAGEFLKSRSSSFDNTDRKLAETQIINLNKELEAFTYSVSHDLRAPLRSVDGYSRILYEDYHEKLDPEGKRLIKVIVNNAGRMGKLIDDLLDFSRLGRKEIQRTSIDMEALAKTIASEAIEHESTRKIELIVHPLHRGFGDIDMIRQVWVNLISNAIKYTGKNPEARLEIRSADDGEEVHYSISDNGVGFDMQYAGKLFGVFQRLHRIQDFSGTGVGLAIVKRIISRHNGRVWAEGEVDRGATFHFTIPNYNGK
jgi:PAS domain S-box-containing protein